MINIIAIGLVLSLIAPTPIEPIGIITERSPTFKWSGYANTLVIDDSENLQDPNFFKLKSNSYKLDEQLDFTTYYYKLVGNKESEIKSFTVNSLVQVKATEEGDQIQVQNEGNTLVKAAMPTGFTIIDQKSSKSLPKTDITISEP